MAAGDAQRLLGDEVLNQAFDFVKHSALEAAMRCAPGDDIGRHRYLLADPWLLGRYHLCGER